jgi:hypothetical protein
MKFHHLLVLAAAVALIFAFGCQKKPAPTAAGTAATAVVETAPPEEPVVATPDAAGAKPLETPADVCKTLLLEGLTYTMAVVGWDNPFAVTMTDRALANVKMLAGPAQGEEKDVLAKAEVDLGGVKAKLDGVISSNGSLKQEELDALKDTLKATRASLAALYAPKGAPLSEAEGKKLKEGKAMADEKLKEGGDMKKKKTAEGAGGK